MNKDKKRKKLKNKIDKNKNIKNIENKNNKSEIIISLIIKIILKNAYFYYINKQIQKNIPLYIYLNLKDNLKNLLKMYYINYDSEFYKRKIKVENNIKTNKWIEIIEPNPSHLDSGMSSFIQQKKIVNQINENCELNSKFDSENQTMGQIGIFQNSKILTNNLENISNNDSIKLKKEIIINNKTKKSNEIIDLPSYDIPLEKFEKKYKNIIIPDDENLKLKNNIENNESKKKITKPDKKKIKYFNNNIYTFDPNGKIIYIKKINIEHLSKELLFVKSKIETKNNNIYKKLNNNFNNLEKFKTNNNINDVIKNNSNLNIEPNKINTDNINNLNNTSTSLISSLSFSEKIKNKKIDTKEKIKKCQPAGSNFGMMKPETGVIIKENNQQKIGGFNYKKISINDYKKLLEENFILNKNIYSNNNSNISNNKNISTITNKTFEINDSSNSNFNEKLFSSNNRESFPLILHSNNTSIKIDNYNRNYKRLNNSFKNNLKNKITIINNSYNYIRRELSENNFDSLNVSNKNIKLNKNNSDLGNIFSKIFKQNKLKNNNKSDLLSYNKKYLFKNFSLPNLNNKNINLNNKLIYRNFHKEPMKQFFKKEISLNQLNTKLPRNRKFNFNKLQFKYKLNLIRSSSDNKININK